MLFKKCAVCGKEFETVYHSKLYCSPECKRIGVTEWQRNMRQKKREEKEPQISKCPICGNDFVVTTTQRKYCSDDCQQKGYALLEKEYKAKKRKVKELNKMMSDALNAGKMQDNEKMQAIIDELTGEEITQHSFKMLDRAISKSVRVRRKQNMTLLAQDAIEAERLGLSYGQYQAMIEGKI